MSYANKRPRRRRASSRRTSSRRCPNGKVKFGQRRGKCRKVRVLPCKGYAFSGPRKDGRPPQLVCKARTVATAKKYARLYTPAEVREYRAAKSAARKHRARVAAARPGPTQGFRWA